MIPPLNTFDLKSHRVIQPLQTKLDLILQKTANNVNEGKNMRKYLQG